MLLSSDKVASITPDIRRLRAFTKVELKPGETRKVIFQLKADDLAFAGADGRWRPEEGGFGIQVSTEIIDIKCSATRVWDTPNRCTPAIEMRNFNEFTESPYLAMTGSVYIN